MKTIDIKAKVHDRLALIAKATVLSDTPCETITEHDVFYNIEHGRLKLRKFEDGSSQLIYYDRSDDKGPKLKSLDFVSLPTEATSALSTVLCKALGEYGTVKKTRKIFTKGNTRIHIDAVDDLGDFMELEVQLRDDQNPEDGKNIARCLLTKLGINESDLVSGAYRDLLSHKTHKS